MNPSFKGGVHIHDYKYTKNLPIEIMPAPGVVKISLGQHSGVPMKPLVAPGDYVFRGQAVGSSDAVMSCPVHSSVSGKVRAVESVIDAARAEAVGAIVIENDGQGTLDPSILRYREEYKRPEELTPDEVIEIIKNAGVVGLGGAVFPTHIKIKGSIGKAKTMLVNCAECEPFLSSDYRLMLEEADAIIGGIDILIGTVGIEKTIIAVEDNKADAAELLAGKVAGRDDIEVRLLKTKYPQGDKSQIIYALSGEEPKRGVRLSDIGYMIINVATTAAVWRAVTEGMPLIDRIVTVAGDCVANPKNLLIPNGTPVSDIIEFCGGFIREPKKIIGGGPMMGTALWDMTAVAGKSTSGILAFSGRENIGGECCINCGRCLFHCPMRLMPNYLARLSKANKYEDCAGYNLDDCIECGTCSFVCPGNVEIVQYIQAAKSARRAAAGR